MLPAVLAGQMDMSKSRYGQQEYAPSCPLVKRGRKII